MTTAETVAQRLWDEADAEGRLRILRVWQERARFHIGPGRGDVLGRAWADLPPAWGECIARALFMVVK